MSNGSLYDIVRHPRIDDRGTNGGKPFRRSAPKLRRRELATAVHHAAEGSRPRDYRSGNGPVRRVGVVFGGVFEGERLSGEVSDGGSDWQTVRGDGAVALDVRLVLKTEDEALIGMTYRGIRHGSPDILARIDRGEEVDPATYYFRIAGFFETAAPKYDWLNSVLAVGIRTSHGPRADLQPVRAAMT